MPATRILLLLLILGGLILFALQNWSPVLPLVIFGLQTLALPLAFWMLGAIAAGALTTLVVAGLFSLANLTSGGRRSRAAQRAATTQAASASNNATWNFGWTGSQTAQPQSESASAGYSGGNRSRDRDDWEGSGQQSEEWEDWSGFQAQAPSREPVDGMPNIRTPVQDTEDQEWSDWDGFEEGQEPADRASRSSTPPPRTDYEIPQEPVNRSQTGSMYSYSYRRSDDTRADNTRADSTRATNTRANQPDKSETVYDADFRVIRPPYRPEPDAEPEFDEPDAADSGFDESFDEPGYREPSFRSPAAADRGTADEDDWDFDDDWSDSPKNKDW
ncbi:hypothetical protein IQ268_14830 [Oculatella sp. LEGE 06141]|uniref:hypothetical protein n=1 Tax=Oculatella sp. LEGE 06141 TaxID=1828648 RepID=UPI001882CE34|nr:hypothetical protein [Oculatella sp. LEGE 06141]MBE9179843.1 hypothetical protein [Oculatella sp. LEGE 06141]